MSHIAGSATLAPTKTITIETAPMPLIGRFSMLKSLNKSTENFRLSDESRTTKPEAAYSQNQIDVKKVE